MHLDDIHCANLTTSGATLRLFDLESTTSPFFDLFLPILWSSGFLRPFSDLLFDGKDLRKDGWSKEPGALPRRRLEAIFFSSSTTYIAPCICAHIHPHEGSSCPAMLSNSYMTLKACIGLSSHLSIHFKCLQRRLSNYACIASIHQNGSGLFLWTPGRRPDRACKPTHAKTP